MTRIRWSLAVLACVFGAATIAEVGHGHDLESIVMTAIPGVVLAAGWYLAGWIEFRR